MRKATLLIILLFIGHQLVAQNSLVGDGFGGRLWYKSYNYTVGSYSAYTVCGPEKQLYGWGANNKRQLGNAAVLLTGSDVPVEVTGMDSILYYACGYAMAAIKTNKSGWFWGQNQTLPIQVIDDVFFVDAGVYSAAFIKNDSTVWSVGNEFSQSFGDGPNANPWSLNPIKMKNIDKAVRLSVGLLTTIILLENGDVYSTGTGAALGTGSSSVIEDEPVKINSLANIVDIKSTSHTNIALGQNGNVWAWGKAIGASGPSQFGQGAYIGDLSVPTQITALKDIVAISGCTDGYHFLALDKDRNCFGWGNNFGSALGGNAVFYDTPILLATDVVEIMAGEYYSYLIKTDGSMHAVGRSNPAGGSIWMNLYDSMRTELTEIDPTHFDFDLCEPSVVNPIDTPIVYPPNDSTSNIEEIVIRFPNAISPNGDNRNDFFRPIIKPGSIIENYELRIFNRWGQRVFQSKNTNKGWDGTLSNQQQPISTFFYFAVFNTPNNAKQMVKGDVTLIR